MTDVPSVTLAGGDMNPRLNCSLGVTLARAARFDLRRLRLRTGRERDQNGDGGDERLHAALL